MTELPESKQQQRDQAQINYLARQGSSKELFQHSVIWLLCFIATKLNKPYLDIE